MSFLNALGRYSRQGQLRLRLVLKVSGADGALDTSDEGLIDLSAASEVLLVVVPRAPFAYAWRPGCVGGYPGSGGDPAPVLAGAMSDGTLFVSNPGFVERVWPAGWSATVPAGLYDVRVFATIGPETGCVLDQPIAFT